MVELVIFCIYKLLADCIVGPSAMTQWHTDWRPDGSPGKAFTSLRNGMPLNASSNQFGNVHELKTSRNISDGQIFHDVNSGEIEKNPETRTRPQKIIGIKDAPYNAKCDGVTDDGPVLKAALASDRKIQIPAGGICLISTTVGGTGLSNLTIELLPGAVVKQSNKLVGKLFQFNDARRVRLTGSGRESVIDVSSAPNSLAGQANDAVYFAGSFSSECEVDHIHFYAGASYIAAGGDSGVFGSCSNVKIYKNIFEGFSDQGVYLSGRGNGDTSTGNAEVYQNIFVNCANAGGSKRLYQGVSWHDNIVKGGHNGFFSGEADTSNLPGIHNHVVNNRFEGMTGTAITSRISRNDRIVGNKGFDLKGNFISLEGTTGALVDNNLLYVDPLISANRKSQAGVILQSRTFNAVTYHSTRNRIMNNTFYGLYAAIRVVGEGQTNNAFYNNVSSDGK